jgi:STE24 endopeptidase
VNPLIRSLFLICAGFFSVAAMAAPFDPDAATRAYLATLSGAARAKSDAYFEGGYWLLLWGTVISILADVLILRFGWSSRFRDWAEKRSRRRFLQSMIWVAPYVLASTIISIPWTLYAGYFREKQYGLLDQSFGGWLGEQGISLLIGIVATSVVIAAIMAGIHKMPKRWWLAGTAGAMLFIGVFALIAPVFINPLFNTYTEMAPGPIRDRIVSMAQSRNIPAEHIYVFDQSKQTKRVSANVSGLGPTIRISLNDNLLNRSSPEEVAAVMGHEMGHYVLGHVWKLIFSLSLLIGFGFWFASKMVPGLFARYGASWGLRGIDDVAAFPLYSIAISLFMLIATPVSKSIIRVNEVQADAFGLDVAREPDGFARAALKLAEYRKLEPSALEEMLFYDHPSGRTRIQMAMDWKAKHPASTTNLRDHPPEAHGQAGHESQ